MLKQFVRDESGIAMGLAVIVVLLVGVMGAGLLVFVRNDLEAVVEVNQGQRAFELADAGIRVAEKQLEKNSTPDLYDGVAEDIGWSESKGGMKLDGLLEGPATAGTRVTIDYQKADETFRVISRGEYRNAKRIVEAIFTVSSADDGAGSSEARLQGWRECYSLNCN